MRTRLCVIGFLLAAGLLRAGNERETEVTQIGLERTACFGLCPVYTLTIERSGKVRYQGKAHVWEVGSKSRKISRDDFARLVKKIEEIKFFDLKDRYDGKSADGSGVTVTDLPTRKTSVTRGKRTKTVENYFRGPKGLRELEELIDEVTNSAEWVRGDFQIDGRN